MKINNKSENNITIQGESNVRVASISAKKQSKLQKLLTKNLYSDPETAVLAELSNNAIDSIVASGKNPIDNPVIVTLDEADTGYYLSVKDNGIGLTHWEFENIFMNYLESTKEEDDDQLGHFGLGGKSPLALNRSYRLITQKEGKRIEYLIWEGKEFTEWDILSESTSEETGVEVIVPINNWEEFNRFRQKAIQKLSYYETVALIIEGALVKNQIFRTEDWQYSSSNSHRYLHFCLKDVYYEIDWNKIGINRIEIPIALRFDLSTGITPLPSREGIIWDKETIDLFKDKIQKVANWFVDKYNTDTKREYDNILEAWSFIKNDNYHVNILEKSFYINPIIKYATNTINPLKINGIVHKDANYYHKLYSTYLNNYTILVEFEYGTWKTKRIYNSIQKAVHNNYPKLILVNEIPKGYLKQYLLEKYDNKNILFIKKERNRKLGSRKEMWGSYSTKIDYRYILGLSLDKKENWRNLINEFNYIENQFIERIIDETNCVVPQEWINKRKEELKENRNKPGYIAKSLNKQEGDITLALSRVGLKSKCVFEKKAIKIADLHKKPSLFIYSSNDEDKELFSKYFQITKRLTNITYCLVGTRELTKLPKIHNFKTMEEFKNSKPFSRIATGLLIDTLLDRYNELYSRNRTIIENAVKPLGNEIKQLKDYLNKCNLDCSGDSDTAIEIVKFAKENNLFDKSILHVYNSVEKQIEDFYFVNLLEVPHTWNKKETEDYTKFVKQFMLYQKLYKDSHKNFEIVEKPKEEELTEDTEF